jgi:hypothetical protein
MEFPGAKCKKFLVKCCQGRFQLSRRLVSRVRASSSADKHFNVLVTCQGFLKVKHLNIPLNLSHNYNINDIMSFRDGDKSQIKPCRWTRKS